MKSRHVRTRSGKHGLTVRHMRAGRYRVLVRAVDLAGNRSRLKHARVTVR